MKKPPVIAWDSADEMHKIEQGVQRLVRNINNLRDEKRDYKDLTDGKRIDDEDGEYAAAA